MTRSVKQTVGFVALGSLLIVALMLYSAITTYYRNACAQDQLIVSDQAAIAAAKRLVVAENTFSSNFSGGSQSFVALLSENPNCCSARKSFDYGLLSTVWDVALSTERPKFSALILINGCGNRILDSGWQHN